MATDKQPVILKSPVPEPSTKVTNTTQNVKVLKLFQEIFAPLAKEKEADPSFGQKIKAGATWFLGYLLGAIPGKLLGIDAAREVAERFTIEAHGETYFKIKGATYLSQEQLAEFSKKSKDSLLFQIYSHLLAYQEFKATRWFGGNFDPTLEQISDHRYLVLALIGLKLNQLIKGNLPSWQKVEELKKLLIFVHKINADEELIPSRSNNSDRTTLKLTLMQTQDLLKKEINREEQAAHCELLKTLSEGIELNSIIRNLQKYFILLYLPQPMSITSDNWDGFLDALNINKNKIKDVDYNTFMQNCSTPNYFQGVAEYANVLKKSKENYDFLKALLFPKETSNDRNEKLIFQLNKLSAALEILKTIARQGSSTGVVLTNMLNTLENPGQVNGLPVNTFIKNLLRVLSETNKLLEQLDQQSDQHYFNNQKTLDRDKDKGCRQSKLIGDSLKDKITEMREIATSLNNVLKNAKEITTDFKTEVTKFQQAAADLSVSVFEEDKEQHKALPSNSLLLSSMVMIEGSAPVNQLPNTPQLKALPAADNMSKWRNKFQERLEKAEQHTKTLEKKLQEAELRRARPSTSSSSSSTDPAPIMPNPLPANQILTFSIVFPKNDEEATEIVTHLEKKNKELQAELSKKRGTAEEAVVIDSEASNNGNGEQIKRLQEEKYLEKLQLDLKITSLQQTCKTSFLNSLTFVWPNLNIDFQDRLKFDSEKDQLPANQIGTILRDTKKYLDTFLDQLRNDYCFSTPNNPPSHHNILHVNGIVDSMKESLNKYYASFNDILLKSLPSKTTGDFDTTTLLQAMEKATSELISTFLKEVSSNFEPFIRENPKSRLNAVLNTKTKELAAKYAITSSSSSSSSVSFKEGKTIFEDMLDHKPVQPTGGNADNLWKFFKETTDLKGESFSDDTKQTVFHALGGDQNLPAQASLTIGEKTLSLQPVFTFFSSHSTIKQEMKAWQPSPSQQKQ
jgi:hypothetical protein